MLPILIAIAVILLLGIVVAFVSSNRSDEQVLGTAPTSPNYGVSPAAPSDSFGSSSPAPPPTGASASSYEAFDTQRLRVGATVASIHGSGQITGAIHLSEDGSQWSEYLIADPSNGAWWLAVEHEHGLQLTAFSPVSVAERPGGNKLNYQGSTFNKIEGGTASYTSTGNADVNPSGRCEYIDYRGPTGQVLGFERFDGAEWEASLGQVLSPSNVSVS